MPVEIMVYMALAMVSMVLAPAHVMDVLEPPETSQTDNELFQPWVYLLLWFVFGLSLYGLLRSIKNMVIELLN